MQTVFRNGVSSLDRKIKLVNYLPQIMGEILEFKELTEAETTEMVKLYHAIQLVADDQYVESATENGVKRWESILKILPKGTDLLEERKFRIVTRLNEKLPYSYRMLLQQLETICGKSGYTVELKEDEYKLIVKVALTVKSNFDDVDLLLHRVVPANLVIDLSLKYNQHSTLEKFTHAKLASYTHEFLRNEVIDLSLEYNQHSTLEKFTHAKLASYTYGFLRNEVIA
ncbi:putative phage tail protein [Sinanaerobacter sp. ZZT-01]|uniref:putative phage tail protein n=1 Tax=Sinanaerobacter sp. ZZT-01 TaxID=3111540 RepID=UPI002D796F72|nr:putative phage tail protein [Sinanaerobacter sp. ZZT-01]WRR94083.1 putative phage tail protein [Sinanaerobacter sp. ZZT-01]